jgi:DNA-binding NtrC family response regulator
VIENPSRDRALTAAVEQAAGQACEVRSLAAMRSPLRSDRGGLLVVLATSPAMTRLGRQLLQEIRLQKLPLGLVVLAPENGPQPPPADLEEHGARVLGWPREAAKLAQILAELPPGPDDGNPVAAGLKEPLPDTRVLVQTPSLLPLADKLLLAAKHEVTILLTGESGTGKTLLARLLHDLSPRSADRFLVVPCDAIARPLVASELFGHVRGAFPGADQDKIGKFAAAGNGTLLLDEIGVLDLEQQAKLLRVVESGEFEPVGSTQTYRSACRLIVTSNRNLAQEVERGRFRVDLYYRLNVLAIHLPPLRERVGDIRPLVRALAARFNTKFGKELFDISPEAMATLEAYPWPGNVRELENAVQHAVLLSQGPILEQHHLAEVIQHPLAPNLDPSERTLLYRALAKHQYNRTQAAQEMGISRVTLYRKLKKYGFLADPASNQ